MYLGYGIDVSLNDLMFGPTIGLRETRYNILFTASYFSRFWAKRVLVDYGNDMFIQFWERRSFLSFGIDKKIKLKGNGVNQKGLLIGVNELYTYGHFRGATIIPQNDWIVMPNLGFYSEGNVGGFSLNLEYIDFKMINVSPIRLNASAYLYVFHGYQKGC